MFSFDAFFAAADSENLKSTIMYMETKDRYQGSLEAVSVCQKLAETINSYGLAENVRLLNFPTSAEKQYLGFSLPAKWDVIRGQFEACMESDDRLRLDHTGSPLLVATNSSNFSGTAKIVAFEDTQDFRNCVAIYSGDRTKFNLALECVQRSGGKGIISNAFGKLIGETQARGRIELPANSALFALSVTDVEAQQLRNGMSRREIYARFDVVTGCDGGLPVLEYVSEPQAKNEIWLTAHICHPRPGANDNASGVAVALEVIRLLARAREAGRTVPAIRVLLAPEYVGMARYLVHCQSRPYFVINIDTVGGDAHITGASLELETAPEFLTSTFQRRLSDLVQKHSDRLPNQQCIIAPFAGYSDHAIFAARCINVPAVQFGQSADQYNHTDQDTVENISFPQLQWLCATLSEYLCEASSALDDVATESLHVDSSRETDYPFNIRSLISLLPERERDFISTHLARRKRTYRELQNIWLLAQRDYTSEAILTYLIEIYSDIEKEVVNRFIAVIFAARRKMAERKVC